MFQPVKRLSKAIPITDPETGKEVNISATSEKVNHETESNQDKPRSRQPSVTESKPQPVQLSQGEHLSHLSMYSDRFDSCEFLTISFQKVKRFRWKSHLQKKLKMRHQSQLSQFQRYFLIYCAQTQGIAVRAGLSCAGCGAKCVQDVILENNRIK